MGLAILSTLPSVRSWALSPSFERERDSLSRLLLLLAPSDDGLSSSLFATVKRGTGSSRLEKASGVYSSISCKRSIIVIRSLRSCGRTMSASRGTCYDGGLSLWHVTVQGIKMLASTAYKRYVDSGCHHIAELEQRRYLRRNQGFRSSCSWLSQPWNGDDGVVVPKVPWVPQWLCGWCVWLVMMAEADEGVPTCRGKGSLDLCCPSHPVTC